MKEKPLLLEPDGTLFREIRLDPESPIPDHLQICRRIEQLIRTGVLKEGARLPPTKEMVTLLGVNVNRVQQAMDMLATSGLVRRARGRGTFVSPRAVRPMIGIACGQNLLEEAAHFPRALSDCLKEQIEDRHFNVMIYDRMGQPRGGERSRARLDHDLRHHQFAGVITISLHSIRKLIGIVGEEMPMVSFGVLYRETDLSLNSRVAAIESTRWLIRRGCRKLACFYGEGDRRRVTGAHIRDLDGFLETAAQAGLTVADECLVHCSRSAGGPLPRTLDSFDRLMYEATLPMITKWRRANCFPDGIVVKDDIACRGIVAAVASCLQPGEKPPEIITQGNEGLPHFYVLPVARYVISPMEAAHRLLHRLDAKIASGRRTMERELISGRIIEPFR